MYILQNLPMQKAVKPYGRAGVLALHIYGLRHAYIIHNIHMYGSAESDFNP